MSPDFASFNFSNSSVGDGVILGNSNLCAGVSPDGPHLLFCELCLGEHGSFGGSPLVGHVMIVVGKCAQKHVSSFRAGGVVAHMADKLSCGDRSMHKYPRFSGNNRRPSFDVDPSIAFGVSCSVPLKAAKTVNFLGGSVPRQATSQTGGESVEASFSHDRNLLNLLLIGKCSSPNP